MPLVYSGETVTASSEEQEVAPHPVTDQMCFVDQNMARNSQMQDHVLLNIQIVRCKPDEICNPAKESQYYGRGLGYVFFHRNCVIITRH